MSFNKKDLNEKFISFLDQVKDEDPKTVTHLNDRVLVIDGLNTFIRAFAVNPSINDDGLHIGGMIGFVKLVFLNMIQNNLVLMMLKKQIV